MDTAYRREEHWNSLSHGLGGLLGLIGFYLLWIRSPNHLPYGHFSVVVYSCSIILLFAASAIYHAVHVKSLKAILRILDHIAIYYLIAGTYTPVALITLVDGNGWLIFTAVWTLALLGTVLKIFFTGKFEVFSLMLYLIMGWMIVFDVGNLIEQSSKMAIFLLFLGGMFYTGGIFFYVKRSIPYNHLIWHICVLFGALSHWLYIYLEVIPK